jgi:hypothetical protein
MFAPTEGNPWCKSCASMSSIGNNSRMTPAVAWGGGSVNLVGAWRGTPAGQAMEI